MGGQLATGSSIYMASAGVPAADGAGLSSIKSFSQLLTSIAAMPLAGGTFTGNVLFTDNTYDIGASGATRPRTVYAGTSVITPLLNNTNAAALTLGNATYGVTVPGVTNLSSPSGTIAKVGGWSILGDSNSGGWGLDVGGLVAAQYGRLSLWTSGTKWVEIGATGAATFSGDISMAKTSGPGYIRAYSYLAPTTRNVYMHHDGYNAYIGVYDGAAYGGVIIQSEGGPVSLYKSGVNHKFRVYNSALNTYTELTHNTLSTLSGNLYLSPASAHSYFYTAGTNSKVRVFNSTGGVSSDVTHDGTNGIISTTAGNLNLVPTGGTVAVTGGITASGVVSHGAYTVATLPSAGSNAGKMAQVTDSNVAASGNYGATVAAGGANRVKVFSDGTNWVIA